MNETDRMHRFAFVRVAGVEHGVNGRSADVKSEWVGFL
jgi:hypothetical protein